MKTQIGRTYLLLGIALILFASAELLELTGKWQDFFRGATAGFAIAGCISFIILLVGHYKQRKA